MVNDINNLIDCNTLFKGLKEEECLMLKSRAKVLTFKKDEFIFNINEKSDGIYILISGTAVITVHRGKRDVINRIIFKDQLFGLDNALDNSLRTKGAKAVGGEVSVLFFPLEVIQQLMLENNAFGLMLFGVLVKNLKKIEGRLESFVFQDAKDRIIDFIKINASNSGVQVGTETLIRHSFTQQNIADYTGTSRQTVTTILQELRSKNKISFQRKRILVRNLAML